MRTYADRYGMGQVDVEPALVEAFKAHTWPGNVRELENTVARLLALAADDRLTLALWRSLDRSPRDDHAILASAVGRSRARAIRCARASRRFERSIIAAEFEAANKNQSETARRLGVSRPALIEKLHKYGAHRSRMSRDDDPSAGVSAPCARSLIALACLAVVACSRAKGRPGADPQTRARIVSLSPSTTEALFAIGAGAQLVGRSRYCDYPPEVATLPQIGGYVDPSFEAILALAARRS